MRKTPEQVQVAVEAAIDQKKLRKAERILLKMLADDADCITGHFYLAVVYRRTGQFDLALRHGRRTLRLNPAEANACLNLGLIYECMGKTKLAVAYYKRELSRDPGSPETLYNLGHLYFDQHRWRRASEYLDRCFKMRYGFGIEETVYKLGTCYYKLNDIQSFIKLYEAYLQMVPGAAWALANLGGALLHAKNYKGAILRLRRAKELGFWGDVSEKLALARRRYQKSKPARTLKRLIRMCEDYRM